MSAVVRKCQAGGPHWRPTSHHSPNIPFVCFWHVSPAKFQYSTFSDFFQEKKYFFRLSWNSWIVTVPNPDHPSPSVLGGISLVQRLKEICLNLKLFQNLSCWPGQEPPPTWEPVGPSLTSTDQGLLLLLNQHKLSNKLNYTNLETLPIKINNSAIKFNV